MVMKGTHIAIAKTQPKSRRQTTQKYLNACGVKQTHHLTHNNYNKLTKTQSYHSLGMN